LYEEEEEEDEEQDDDDHEIYFSLSYGVQLTV
jgi:hypothetical protein